MQSNHPFSQAGPHVEGIKEPDQTEYAKANGDVDENFADINFLFLLLAVKCRGLLIFPWKGSSFTGHHSLPLPAHPALLTLETRGGKTKIFGFKYFVLIVKALFQTMISYALINHPFYEFEPDLCSRFLLKLYL